MTNFDIVQDMLEAELSHPLASPTYTKAELSVFLSQRVAERLNLQKRMGATYGKYLETGDYRSVLGEQIELNLALLNAAYSSLAILGVNANEAFKHLYVDNDADLSKFVDQALDGFLTEESK